MKRMKIYKFYFLSEVMLYCKVKWNHILLNTNKIQPKYQSCKKRKKGMNKKLVTFKQNTTSTNDNFHRTSR